MGRCEPKPRLNVAIASDANVPPAPCVKINDGDASWPGFSFELAWSSGHVKMQVIALGEEGISKGCWPILGRWLVDDHLHQSKGNM